MDKHPALTLADFKQIQSVFENANPYPLVFNVRCPECFSRFYEHIDGHYECKGCFAWYSPLEISSAFTLS